MSDTTPEHTKRNQGRQRKDGAHPDILAAYAYVDSVCHTANLPGPAWYGWAIREAFLAGISHAAASPAAEVPHAAASRRALDALAQMGPEEVRQTFVDAGIVDESGRLTEAYATAPDLPEPCARCSEALCECGTGRAGGGGS